MLLNSIVAWNLGAKERNSKGKMPLKHHHFLMCVAQTMLDTKMTMMVLNKKKCLRKKQRSVALPAGMVQLAEGSHALAQAY
jgi:hypothetical protein